MYHLYVRTNFRTADTVHAMLRLRIRGRRSKFLFLIYPFAPCRIRYDAVGFFVHAALSSTVDLSVFGLPIGATVGISSTITVIATIVMATTISQWTCLRELELPTCRWRRSPSLRRFPNCRRGVVFGLEYAEAPLNVVESLKPLGAGRRQNMANPATLEIDADHRWR
jgi:hypothetical protein